MEYLASLRACARSLDLEEDPVELLRELKPQLSDLEKELEGARTVLEWCAINSIILPRGSVVDLRGQVDAVVDSPSATVTALKQLWTTVSRSLQPLSRQLPDSTATARQFLQEFHGRSIIFDRLISSLRTTQRWMGRKGGSERGGLHKRRQDPRKATWLS